MRTDSGPAVYNRVMSTKHSNLITAILTQEGDWTVAEDTSTHVTSQGKTKDEALQNLREAVTLYLEETGEQFVPQSRVTLATVEL